MTYTNVRTNAGVAAAWARQSAASTAHLRTDGVDLFSYSLRIGATTSTGRKILGQFDASGDYHSMTTSHHVGVAKRYADEVVAPDVLRVMPSPLRIENPGEFDCCEHCIDWTTGKVHNHPTPCGYVVNLDTPDLNRSCQPHPGDNALREAREAHSEVSTAGHPRYCLCVDHSASTADAIRRERAQAKCKRYEGFGTINGEDVCRCGDTATAHDADRVAHARGAHTLPRVGCVDCGLAFEVMS